VVGASVIAGPTTPYPLLSQGGEPFSWFLGARQPAGMSDYSRIGGNCATEYVGRFDNARQSKSSPQFQFRCRLTCPHSTHFPTHFPLDKPTNL
jgi:hypothetical protein